MAQRANKDRANSRSVKSNYNTNNPVSARYTNSTINKPNVQTENSIVCVTKFKTIDSARGNLSAGKSYH